MRKKRILTLIGSVCLALMLAVPLVTSCAPATPEEAAGEIAELEAEIDDLEGDVAAEKAKTKKLQDEIAELRAPGEVYEWRLQTYYTSTLFSEMEPPYTDDIERVTGGRIKVTPFPGEEVIPSEEIMHAVSAGTIEMGHGSASWFSDLDIGRIESCLPMSWLDTMSAQVIWEKMGFRDLLVDAYAEHGIHYIGPVFAAPYALISKEPVNSLDDLREMKVRCGPGAAKVLAGLDIPTVYLSPGEMYLGLATGTIDAVLWGGAVEYEQMGFFEVAPYYCTSALNLPLADCLLINLDIWDGLSDDLKAGIKLSTSQASLRYWTWVFQEESRARSELRAEGHLTSLPSEDMAALTEAALVFWDELASISPRNAQAIEILKERARIEGRL